jgi:glycosyltransferase involved in cell wall biosynthesis
VFDAYAQAVPVIGSDTDGLKAYVRHDETGWLVARGNAEELARAIERAQRSSAELDRMGMRARGEASRFTHRAMHRTRRRILHEVLGV